MSLHAQLSPEAEARLRAQKRTSTITSFIIALLGMALVAVILLIISLTINIKEIPTIVSYQSGNVDDENLQAKKVTTTTQRKPSAPSSSMAKVIASNSASPTAVPVPEIDVPEPSTNFGDGDDFGSGWGDGSDGGGGGSFGAIPDTMKKRCSRQDRLQRLAENGGNEACEEAVVSGLRYLAKTQNANGSWGTGKPVAMTALAILAYLGHCETVQSPEFGLNVLNGLVFLIDVANKQDGKLADNLTNRHWCYEHSIAVYALAEAYSLCTNSFGENIPMLEEAVLSSGQFLINNQNVNGGWAYAYEVSGGHTDTSISGWHLQALKAMKVTGLKFSGIPKASKKGLEFFESCQDSDGAIGYRGPGGAKGRSMKGATLTGVGALCFQMWDEGRRRPARNAVKWVHENVEFEWAGPSADLYGHYYIAQSMMNAGGDYWKSYNAKFRDETLKNQNKDGSWKDVPAADAVGAQFKGNGKESIHYRTCLTILMLETYYRFLPASM